MLAKGSCGWPELTMAFREDDKIFIGYTSPIDYKAILGIILLTVLDSQFVYHHHYLHHHCSSGEHSNDNTIGYSILLFSTYGIKTWHLTSSLEKGTQTSLLQVLSGSRHFSFNKENTVTIRITTDSSIKMADIPKGDEVSEAERTKKDAKSSGYLR